MVNYKINIFVVLSIVLLPAFLKAQTIIKGQVQDGLTGAFVSGAEVSAEGKSTTTDGDGVFQFEVTPTGDVLTVRFSSNGYEVLNTEIKKPGTEVDLGIVRMKQSIDLSLISQTNDASVVVTLDDDTEGEGDNQSVSGLLSASRDPFASAAAFVFSQGRFRIRGYEYGASTVYFNGAPADDVERGGVYWGAWGGLNDVMRNSTVTLGLAAATDNFGGIAGSTSLDTRASSHRKQTRLTYSITNRSYRQRAMGTYSTGMMANGWAVSVAASRRWANEGYVPGTFYDAYSMFVSVDKKVSKNHLINLTALAAPNKRGKQGAATEEMYDLAGTNFYNSYWGYQEGEKRNSRVSNFFQPIVSLRHDWTLSKTTKLTTSVMGQAGRNGSTALDWYNAKDPRPDYYRYLPSYIENEQSALVEDLYRNDENVRQIDWNALYQTNYNNHAVIENANGSGNTVEGNRSLYIVEDRRYDSKRLNFASTLNSNLSENITLNTGVTYQYFVGDKFKVVDDLLGGDFYVDIDKFAEFGAAGDNDFIQNDLSAPNKIVKEGDVFGYHYETHVRKANAWALANFTYNKFDFFVGASGGNVNFWRNGLLQNGKFPTTSLGESEKSSFFEYAGRAGATFKINGRNYIIANGRYENKAPLVRNAFVSPRTRNQLVENLETEKILTGEIGYVFTAPMAKFRLIGYHTTVQDQTTASSFYLDNAIITDDGTSGGFVNYITTGMDKRYMGIEFGGEVNLTSALKANAAVALSQNIYSNRPSVTVYLDQEAEKLRTSTVYIKNFRLDRSPQSAYTMGFSYRGKQFWTAYVNFNYFANNWIGINPERRTLAAVSYTENPEFSHETVGQDSELWNAIVDQEQFPEAFTMSISGRKSWKIGGKFIYLNVGIDNLLNTTDFKTGGFEQRRFDFEDKNVEKFPNRYYYSKGRTYFVNISFRI